MFPFWDVAIAPVLDAAGARRVVEIGALRGETTEQMLDDLGPDAELHVIDPVPDFDPARARAAASRAATSSTRRSASTCCPRSRRWTPRSSTATTTGTPSTTSCGCCAEVARRHGAPLPVLILHDVLWPYGRRDLYYAPDQIPEEFRQPYAQAGHAARQQAAARPRAGSTRRCATPWTRAGRATA